MAMEVEVFAIVFHIIGSVAIAAGLIKISVVLRRYWLRNPNRKYVFSKVPRADSALLFSAMFFLLLTLIFAIATLSSLQPVMMIQGFIAYLLLLFANLFACFLLKEKIKFVSIRKVKMA